MSVGIRMDLRTAQVHAGRFQRLFPAECFVRWQVAGSVRRRRSDIGDIDHVVIPRIKNVPRESLFDDPKPLNLLFARLDELVAQGVAVKHLYGSQGFRWGDKLRGVDFSGVKHEVCICDSDNWGAYVATKTGPHDLARQLVTGLLRNGRRAKDGRVWACEPCPNFNPDRVCRKDCTYCEGTGLKCVGIIDVPDEETYFKLCGIAYVEPARRY